MEEKNCNEAKCKCGCNGKDEFLEKFGQEDYEETANSLINSLPHSRGLLSEEQINNLIEIIDKRSGNDSIITMRFLYKYYKYFPSDKPLQIVDGELEIINSFATVANRRINNSYIESKNAQVEHLISKVRCKMKLHKVQN